MQLSCNAFTGGTKEERCYRKPPLVFYLKAWQYQAVSGIAGVENIARRQPISVGGALIGRVFSSQASRNEVENTTAISPSFLVSTLHPPFSPPLPLSRNSAVGR